MNQQYRCEQVGASLNVGKGLLTFHLLNMSMAFSMKQKIPWDTYGTQIETKDETLKKLYIWIRTFESSMAVWNLYQSYLYV